MLSFFPRGVLDEILNLIESVSEEFPSYSCNIIQCAENLNMSQSYKQLLLNQKPSLPAPNDNYFVQTELDIRN